MLEHTLHYENKVDAEGNNIFKKLVEICKKGRKCFREILLNY